MDGRRPEVLVRNRIYTPTLNNHDCVCITYNKNPGPTVIMLLKCFLYNIYFNYLLNMKYARNLYSNT